jgi:uncharacterized DUF497 family protein
MEIEYDEQKRRKTLADRQLDFARAEEVFNGASFDIADTRFQYGEDRYITFGILDGRNVAIVWTQRGDDLRRIISMRHVHEDELKARRSTFD